MSMLIHRHINKAEKATAPKKAVAETVKEEKVEQPTLKKRAVRTEKQ